MDLLDAFDLNIGVSFMPGKGLYDEYLHEVVLLARPIQVLSDQLSNLLWSSVRFVWVQYNPPQVRSLVQASLCVAENGM